MIVERHDRQAQDMQRLPAILSFLTLVIVLAGCGGGAPAVEYPIVPNESSIAAGASLYAVNCQTCHASPVSGGERLFGAPRHDVDGHTWHHVDRQLVEWVLDGVPAGSGVMPEFRGRLTEAEVASVLAYIKSTWPGDVRAWQTEGSQAYEDQLGR